MSDPTYTPEQYAAAAGTVDAPPVGTGPSADDLAAKVPAASATEVDVAALMARMDAMGAQLAALQAEQGTGAGEHNLIGASLAARDLIATHYEFSPRKDELVRLADDLVDAARNAVASGDTGPARTVADRLERKLKMWSPGPGDHHYWTQAFGLVSDHIPDAADTVTAAQPSNAPALGSSSGPAKVVAGSVTG